MRSYFKNLPIVTYNGQKSQVRNLMLNAQLTKQVLGDVQSFLPYTVQEGETPTTIAFDYYGHIDYTWLVLFSNSMTDPYTAWPKTQEQFEAYLEKQYGSVQVTYSTIHAYRHLENPDELPDISPTSYLYLPAEDRPQYQPVYLYDHLYELNEKKRQIVLVDKVYAPRISLELEKKLKQ